MIRSWLRFRMIIHIGKSHSGNAVLVREFARSSSIRIAAIDFVSAPTENSWPSGLIGQRSFTPSRIWRKSNQSMERSLTFVPTTARFAHCGAWVCSALPTLNLLNSLRMLKFPMRPRIPKCKGFATIGASRFRTFRAGTRPQSSRCLAPTFNCSPARRRKPRSVCGMPKPGVGCSI